MPQVFVVSVVPYVMEATTTLSGWLCISLLLVKKPRSNTYLDAPPVDDLSIDSVFPSVGRSFDRTDIDEAMTRKLLRI